MLGVLRRWFIPKPPEAVNATYIALVTAARNPFFYEKLEVPDTLDGRFELIVLHLFLLQHRLMLPEGFLAPYATLTPAASSSPGGLRTDKGKREQFAQFLSEAFFYDMDHSVRELGVADTGVAHRIKKMAKAYTGRLQAYTAGLNDPVALRAALSRNLYGTVAEGDVAVLDRLAVYVEKVLEQLAATDEAVIARGEFTWPDVAVMGL
ncbi:MAG: ubiquinol-cytochrome C chaperone family protein [Rickettsiales bacterium]